MYFFLTHQRKTSALYTWQPSISESTVGSTKYGATEFTPQTLKKFSESISSLSDISFDSPTYEKARNIFQNSQYLFIMGFGFHQKIIENLQLDRESLYLHRVFSLSYGLNNQIISQNGHFSFYDSKMTCVDFALKLDMQLNQNLRHSGQISRQTFPSTRHLPSEYDPFKSLEN